MTRPNLGESQTLEQGEGELALIGTALVLLELVELRLHTKPDRVLSPALEDVARIRALLLRAQKLAACRLPATK